MWNGLTVPTVWYFNCPRCGMFTVPTVWCPRMFLLFLQCGILAVPDNVECSRCSYIVVFNCPRQCGMFLLFRQCGILTVPDNVECSYCSDSVEF